MRKLSITLCVLAAVVASVAVAWNVAFPTNSFRYKVTVNVETPEGSKSGSAVREVIVKQTPRIFPEAGVTTIVRGEAVSVDLGKRGVLFALLGSDDEFLVLRTFDSGLGLTRQGARYYEQLQAKAEVAPIYYPPLVAFRDISDPKSVTVAYKPVIKLKDAPGYQYEVAGVEDHMSELFGPGVSLQNITIEMTNELVTWGIETALPWLESNGGAYLDGQSSGGGPALSNLLHGGNFKVGENQ